MQPSIADNPKGFDKRKMITWIITILLPLAVMLMPTNDAFTDSVRLFLAITLAIILVVAFENLPLMIPSISLCINKFSTITSSFCTLVNIYSMDVHGRYDIS